MMLVENWTADLVLTGSPSAANRLEFLARGGRSGLKSLRSMNQKPLFLSLLLTLALPGLARSESDRPNILYLYVDDMGWGSVGPNGQADRKAQGLPYLLTPTLDRLAAEGINFTRAYGCTVCSPARSSQQTGFHQGHTFADRNDPDNAKKAIRTDDLTMGDQLAKAGYVPGYWGKWGYGGSKSQEDPVIDNVQTLPTSHGYQFVVAELHHVRAHTFFQPTLWTAPAKPGAIGGLELKPNSMAPFTDETRYPNTPALQNHPEYPTTAYCDDVYAFAALDFVRAQAQNYQKTGQPFFGLLAVQVPHAPFGEIEQLPDWDAAYRDHPNFTSLSAQSKQWAAMITRLDSHFGNLLAALEDPNSDGDNADSVKDNTLIIFQSDNGGPQHKAREEFFANGGLRGQKGSIFEGGIRVPTLVSWPTKINANSKLKAGTSSDRLLDVTDWLPTFCELAGVASPLGLDGVSIAPTLLGSGQQRTRDYLIHEAGNSQSIIRDNHKLIRSRKALELYDLVADHGEETNLADQHPELVKELEALMLGEHVDEPKGFANTYHHWNGESGSNLSEADNWSNYVYENAGITYLEEKGAPRDSWTAQVLNKTDSPTIAVADQDLTFLGLEVGGTAKQTLQVQAGVQLTARNEIRISENGSVQLDGAVLRSNRWVEVMPGGEISGDVKIEGGLYNHGTITASPLKVSGDFHGAEQSETIADLQRPIEIEGTAYLSGQFNLTSGPSPSQPHVVLKAKQIEGQFSNPNDEVVSANGIRWGISYTEDAVVLTPR